MIEVGLEPAGAAVKHVAGKSRLSVQTCKVFFLEPCDMCTEECTLHCKGKCTEDKAQIVHEHGDHDVLACLWVAVSRCMVLVLQRTCGSCTVSQHVQGIALILW